MKKQGYKKCGDATLALHFWREVKKFRFSEQKNIK